jgi:opacity protein-like surface antigen
MTKLKAALLGTTIVVALAASGGSAFAAKMGGVVVADAPSTMMSGLYVSVFGGASLPNNVTGTYDSYGFTVPMSAGFLIGGAIGAQITDYARAELELSYARHSVNTSTPVSMWNDTYAGSGSVSTLYALGNIWFDLNTGTQFTPYIGGGAGLAVVMPDVHVDYFGSDYDWTAGGIAPAAQFGAGVRMKVTDKVTFDVGYRAKAVFSNTWQEDPNGSASYAAKSMNWLDQTIQAGVSVGF